MEKEGELATSASILSADSQRVRASLFPLFHTMPTCDESVSLGERKRKRGLLWQGLWCRSRGKEEEQRERGG
eukprot:2702467-Rhodomonas_salina.2